MSKTKNELKWPYIFDLSDTPVQMYTENGMYWVSGISPLQELYNNTHDILYYEEGTPINRKTKRLYPPKCHYHKLTSIDEIEEILRIYLEYLVESIEVQKGWTAEEVLEAAKKEAGDRWGNPIDRETLEDYERDEKWDQRGILGFIGSAWSGVSRSRKRHIPDEYRMDGGRRVAIDAVFHAHELSKHVFSRTSGFSKKEDK